MQWISIFSFFLTVLWWYLSCYSSREIFLSSLLYSGSVLCVFVHLILSLVLFILGLDLWEFFWRAGSYFSCLCEAPLCGVSGRYNLLECWPGVGGGAVQVFSSLGLCCGGYGTIEIVGGLVCFSFLSSVCFLLFWRAVVCGRSPFLKLVLFGTILVFLVDFVFYKLLIFFLFVTGGIGRVGTWKTRSLCWSRRSWSTEGWTSRLALRSWSPMCRIWRTTTWCWRMETRRTQSSLRFAVWTVRSFSWRLSWLLWIACCLLMIRQLFGVEWCVSGLIWVVFIIFFLVQFWFDFLF